MKRSLFLGSSLFSVIILAACTGGDVTSTATPTPSPLDPVALGWTYRLVATPTPTAAPLISAAVGGLRPAPDFETTLFQGQEVLGADTLEFSQLIGRGKPVVLNFWAGLCPVCRMEMPELQAFYEEYKDRVILYGLHIGPFVGMGSREDALNRIRELGITYPVGSTDDGTVLEDYNFFGMPTIYFITGDGRIYHQWTGYLDKATLVNTIEEMAGAVGKGEGAR